jgi:NodT family efflux transporter outer membrane factor (OMF) lipoprotein
MKRGLACAAALLAGCAVGPDYQRPQDAVINAPAANGAFAGAGEKAFTGGQAPSRWWRLYGDASLNRLVDQALAANTDLRAAAASLTRARASLDITKDLTWPQANIGAGYAYERLSAEEYLVPGTLPDFRAYELQAGISYQVDLFGQIHRAIEAGQAGVGAAQAAYDTARITVAADTTLAYVEACSAGRELAVAEKLVDIQHRNTDFNRRLFKAGRGISLDVTRAAAQEDQVRSSVRGLEAQRRLALYRLAVLTGRPPEELPPGAAQCAEEPRLDRPLPVGDGAALLRRRPDVRRAEEELRLATAEQGVATASLYPKIILGVSGDTIGLTKNFWKADTFGFSLGPLISWDIPNPKRARATVRGAKAKVEAAFAAYDGVVLGALRETESALTLYARDLDRERYLESARRNANQAASDAETLYRAGRQGYLTVLDADRTQAGAEQSLASAHSRVAADQVLLFLALGGGWEANGTAR